MFFTSNQSIEIQDFSTALNVKSIAFKDSIKDNHMNFSENKATKFEIIAFPII